MLLLTGVGAATTSCEDMFTADNNLVTTDLAPQDTVYQVMGIVDRMRTLADRTVLLGEVRADLVDVDMVHASSDIQQLANNDVSLSNVYNHPSDYYSVINSCNIYLANVDSLLRTHGQYYYEKEICAVKTFRAWCYLELAKIYKEVPFVLDPVLTAGAADDIVKNFKSTKAGMVEICTYFINDLAQYAYDKRNLDLRPSYGGSWAGVGYDNYFIPVRVMLAELYLWRATFSNSQSDYINAIRMYHDYFVYPGQERAVSQNPSAWIDREFRRMADYYYDDFELEHSKGNMPYPHSLVGYSAIMPCDTVAYYGTTNDLRAIFNSQYSNNYYPSVVPSTRIREISADQIYCYYAYTSASVIDTIYGSHEKNEYENEVYVGDLRLGSVYPPAISNISESQYNSSLSSSRYYNLKWTDGSSMLTTDRRQSYIAYFRDNILYLHMAEALNRAGFPETAFAVLKYGLTEDVLSNRKIISQAEFDRLAAIKSYGTALSNLREPRYSSDEELDLQTRGSFVIWPSSVFEFVEKNTASTGGGGTVIVVGGGSTTKQQIGIHSMGCGDTEYNKYYYLDDAETLAGLKTLETVPDTVVRPDPLSDGYTPEEYDAWETAENAWKASVDARDAVKAANEAATAYNLEYLQSDPVKTKRQARVAKLILDEEALEGMFEGYRFYDLMRYSVQTNDYDYLYNTVKQRKGKGTTDEGAAPLAGGNWYLKLPTR